MKHNFKTMLTFSLAMVGSCGAMAHAQALDRNDLAPDAPAVMPAGVENKGNLMFSSKTQDAGEILDLESVKLSYLFRNTGAGPLTITQVKTSCGCTVPELEKKTYMPGESGTLSVTFDPSGKAGTIARNITIFTDSETTPSETLIVRAFVKPVVVIEPRVMPFEAVQKGTSASDEFKIYGRTDDFKVTRATVSDPAVFDIEVKDMGEVDYKGEKLRLSIVKVIVKDTARPDNHRADVTIRTNDERMPIVSTTAIARVLGDLTTDPVRVTMGRMVVGDEFEKEFHVTSKSGKPFNIESVGFSTIALESTTTFEPVNEEKTDWIVKIVGKVSAPAPRFNTPIRIVTDVADEKELTLQMYGQLRNN
ncbi:MAG: DUF1573 domain-containing protein [Phycisphaerales bacterium]|nr:DUF1573 domain-containing protein [Phycisphaerales bacterium]